MLGEEDLIFSNTGAAGVPAASAVESGNSTSSSIDGNCRLPTGGLSIAVIMCLPSFKSRGMESGIRAGSGDGSLAIGPSPRMKTALPAALETALTTTMIVSPGCTTVPSRGESILIAGSSSCARETLVRARIAMKQQDSRRIITPTLAKERHIMDSPHAL